MRKKVIKRLLSLLAILTLVLSSVPVYAATQDIPVQDIAVMGSNELILTQISYNPDNGWVQFVLKDEPNPFFEQDPIFYLNSYAMDYYDWDVDSDGLTNIVTHFDKIDSNNYAMRIEGHWDSTKGVPTVYVKYKSKTVLFARTMYELPVEANTGGGETLEDVLENSDLGQTSYNVSGNFHDFNAYMLNAKPDINAIWEQTPSAHSYYTNNYGLIETDRSWPSSYSDGLLPICDENGKDIVMAVTDIPSEIYMIGLGSDKFIECTSYSSGGTKLGTDYWHYSNSETVRGDFTGEDSQLRIGMVQRLLTSYQTGAAYVKLTLHFEVSAIYNFTEAQQGRGIVMPIIFVSDPEDQFYLNWSDIVALTGNYTGVAAYVMDNVLNPFLLDNEEIIVDQEESVNGTYYNFQMMVDESDTNEFYGYLTLASGDTPNPAYVSIGPETNSTIDVFGYEHTATSIPSQDTYLYRYRIDIKGIPYGTNTYDLLVKYAGDLIYTIPVTLTNTREQDQDSYVNPYGFDLIEHVYSNEILGTDDTRFSSEFKITGTFPDGWYTDTANGHLDVDLLIKTVWFEEFVIQPSSISIDGTDEYLIINADVTEFQTDKYDSNGNIIGHGSGIDDIVYRFRLMDGNTIHDEWLLPVDYVTEAPVKVSEDYAHGDYDVVDQESDNIGDEFSYWDDPWEERDQVADTGGGSSVIGETDSSGGSSSGGFVLPSIPDEDDLKNDPYQWLKDHMLLAGAAFAAVYFIFLNKN